MNRTLRTAWRWSWVVTTPVVLLFVYWATTTWTQWNLFVRERAAPPAGASLHTIGADRAGWLWRQLAARVRPGDLDDVPTELQLRSVQLRIGDAETDALEHALPHGRTPFVSALLVNDHTLRTVQVQHVLDVSTRRGDPKRSLRVRTAAGEPFGGIVEFDLLAPSASPGARYLASRLARALGVLAPRCELVNVFVNGRCAGVHELVERLARVTPGAHGRVPGPLLAADTHVLAGAGAAGAPRSGVGVGVGVGVGAWTGAVGGVDAGADPFTTAEAWIDLASPDVATAGPRAPLVELAAVLQRPMDGAGHARLAALLDLPAWGRWLAFEALAQGAAAVDGGGDDAAIRLFRSSARATFEPALQDVVAWPADRSAADARLGAAATSRLRAWLLANGDVLAARHAALRAFFTTGAAATFLADADHTMARVSAAFAFDPDARPASDDDRDAQLQALALRVRAVFDAVAAEHVQRPPELAWERVDAETVRVVVGGRAPIDELRLRFDGPIVAATSTGTAVAPASDAPTAPTAAPAEAPKAPSPTAAPTAPATAPAFVATISWRRATGPAFVVPVPVRHDGDTLRVAVRLLAELLPEARPGARAGDRPAPVAYDLRLPGLAAARALVDVQAAAGDVVATGTRAATPLPATPVELLFALLPPARPEPETWRGEVVIDGVREVVADLRLEPGTVVRLRPFASLWCRGRVLAEGTAEQPIRIEPHDDGQQPWGTFALSGAGCTGSRLRHCDVRGGSSHLGASGSWPAMVVVHDATDVGLADCTLADNHAGGALLRTAHAALRLERVELRAAAAAGLVVDLGDVVVRDGAFVRCTGDAFVATAATVCAERCRFVDAGGSGLALADGATALVTRGSFDGCERGIAVHDGAVAHVLHADVRRCAEPVRAGRHLTRHAAGGTLVLQRCALAVNGAPPASDSWSRIELVDCSLREPVPEQAGVTAIGSGAAPFAARPEPPPVPPELARLPASSGVAAAWREALGSRRGAER